MIPPHQPHPPFIRLVRDDGDAKVIRSYCSLCRKQVGLKFTVHDKEGEAWRDAIWFHIEPEVPRSLSGSESDSD